MTNEENVKLNREMFPNVLGQTKVLNKARFLIKEQNHSGFFSPTLLSGSFGSGKNVVANSIASHLKCKNNKDEIKPAIEVNCSSISSITQFFDELVIPNIIGNEVTVIMDEIHSLQSVPKLLDALLTIWNTDNAINTYTFAGQTYDFDLSRISFICMTSEAHLLPEALRSRMEVVQMEALKIHELAQIAAKKLKNVKVSHDLLLDIASHGRKNGRESYRLGKLISQYVAQNGLQELHFDHWYEIKNQLGIRKDGLSNGEFRVLNYLKEHGDSTLSKISSALNLTASATRLGNEAYLLANNYIEILQPKGRRLTIKAHKYLEEVKD